MTTNKPHKPTGVSDKQYELLVAIDGFIRENSCPPTWREISARTGVRLSTLRDRAVCLVRTGHLRNIPGSHRSLSITATGKRAVRTQRLTTTSEV